MESHHVANSERRDQAPCAVGVGQVEAGVGGQLLHALQGAGPAANGLQRKPLVDAQRVVFETVEEVPESLGG